MAKITVEILKDGRYLLENFDAIEAQKGDIVEIRAGGYYMKVLDMGLVRPFTPTPEEGEEAPEAVLHEEEAAKPDAPAPTEAEADEDPIGSLMEINGVGQKTAVKLVNGGIASKRAFVSADAVELSEIAGTTVAKIQGWQAEAARLLEA